MSLSFKVWIHCITTHKYCHFTEGIGQKSLSYTHYDLLQTGENNLVFLSFPFFNKQFSPHRQYCKKKRFIQMKTTEQAAVCMPGLSVVLCHCTRHEAGGQNCWDKDQMRKEKTINEVCKWKKCGRVKKWKETLIIPRYACMWKAGLTHWHFKRDMSGELI